MSLPNDDLTPLRSRLARVRLLAMDVDGVLTDGGLVIDSAGGAQKRFHVADGLGLVLARQCGLTLAWVTGRGDAASVRRAAELHIPHLLSGVRDKGSALKTLLASLGFAQEEAAYIGDDWNDLPAFAAVGVRFAVANAAEPLKKQADYVTIREGGFGAVREVCDLFVDAHGGEEAHLQRYLLSLRLPTDPEAVGQ